MRTVTLMAGFLGGVDRRSGCSGARPMLTRGTYRAFPRRPRHTPLVAPLLRTSHRDHHPAAVAEAKGDQTVAVCLPARDEEATVGTIVEAIRRDLCEAAPVIDELVVVDDHSDDATAEVARAAGQLRASASPITP